jgi:outer membrane protein OmpA-like peptidoglycan-associated protein
MRRVGAIALGALLSAGAAAAQEGRFDVQAFRPLGAPQDLVMVAQSRPLSHLSFAVGGYLSLALDPLVLLEKATGSKSVNVISSQLELDLMAALGLFEWAEIAVALPIVLYQTGDNLNDVGTEGSVQSAALGDLRVTGKVAIPYLRRKAEARGFGMSLALQVSFPTGVVDAFTSDGAVTFNPYLIADYRFGTGVLIAANAGVWFRPERQWSGLQVGDMSTFGLGAEVPVVRRWGLTIIGEVFGAASLTKLPGSPREVPAEVLLGIRWYSSSGVTLTVGGSFGCDCAFGAPALRLFTSLIWVPMKTREYEALERFKVPPADPDNDGLIGDQDKCPDKPGPVENHGCPDEDRDKDGIVDRLDKCPEEPAAPGSTDGCPRVRIQGRKIIILEQVHFATDQDVILPESFPILEDVARLLKVHAELLQVLVEGHCDIRASDEYNMDLSRRRAASVMRFLIAQGVAPSRLRSEGFGRRRPIAPNSTEAGMALNRRVEFTIEHIGTMTRPLSGAPASTAALPGPDQVLPIKPSTLPSQGVLPQLEAPQSNLPQAPLHKNVLPTQDPAGAPAPIGPPPTEKP